MKVWLIVFLLANGEQATASSVWQPSKYECERLRHTLEPEANAKGWTARCLAWDIPEDFSVVRSADSEVSVAEAAICDHSQVLRRLQELTYKVDALDASVDQVGSSTKNMGSSLRDLDRSIKRVEGSVHSLPSYRCVH